MIDCFALTWAVRFLRRGFSPFITPTATALPRCYWLRDMAVRMRQTLARPWVGVCVPLALSLPYFNAIELSSIYFSSITVFNDISGQI